MKKILALILCIAIVSSFIPPVFAKETLEDEKIQMLVDLKLIDKYEPEANVTRQMLSDALDLIYAQGTYDLYLERRDMSYPVLFGQMLMIMVDITGYTPFIELNKLDNKNLQSYKSVAVKAGFSINSNAAYTDAITMKDYANLLYEALCEVNLLNVELYNPSKKQYYIDNNATILNSVLNLTEFNGIVTGVDNTSYKGEVHGKKGFVAIDGIWYKTTLEKDLLNLIGMNVSYLYDEKENVIKSIFASEGSNNVYNVNSYDIDALATTNLKLTYQKENEREKTLKISPEADYIYNGALYKYYTKDDLMLDDCFYKLIDNTSDGKIDVIIAEKYETFMTDIVIMDENKIIDNKSNVYDLTDYFEEGGKIYNTDGDSITLDDFGAFSIISYLKSKDNKYTKFIVSQDTEEGIFNEMQSDYRYVYLSGEKYETLTKYHKNRQEYDLVNLGDEVKLFFDFAGFVADIKRISGILKAGYIIDNLSEDEKRPKLQMLKEDGKVEMVEFASSVVVDNVKKAKATITSYTPIFKNGEVVPQLVLYKDNNDGKIFYIDTAQDNAQIGKTSSDSDFTLDYDYEKESSLRIINVNGKKVLGSKYLPDTETKLFGVSTEIDECYVQTGSALGTGTSYKIKLYNVNDDYVPMYATIEITPKLGEWVDWYNTTYVVENVTQVYDKATDDNYYKLIYYDGKGNIKASLIRDGDLITPNGNPLSGDNRLRQVKAKDLKKGTVLQIKEDKHGISSISIQAMPMDDDSEKMFEKANNSTSYDYGITEYLFNGATMCAFGKVIKRVPGGIVVNNHIPTSVEAANGAVFPMDSWNRIYPFTSSDNVWFYDKSKDELKFAPATEILEDDMIFIHRNGGTVTTAIIYR